MAEGIRPIRRIVTGNDAQGRSRVTYDSAAPGVKESAFKKGTGMTDIWMFERSPAPLSGDRDDGNLPFHFEPPEHGARLRIVQSDSRPEHYDGASDKYVTAEHPPRRTEGGTWERGRQNLYTTRIHKSETLDYGILVSGERILVTDAGKHLIKPGDVVIQIGSWHAWEETRAGSQMAFVMMAGRFEEPADGAVAFAGKPDARGSRRIVVVDENERSRAIADGPSPHVRTDPERPGFVSSRMWVTGATPVPLKGLRESLPGPVALAPPPGGSICRVDVFPANERMPPRMTRAPVLEFALVISGRPTLVLDTGDVALGAGDTVVERGTQHAWINRSGAPAVVAFSSHAGAW